jgi:hypothetical protein
MSLTGGEVYELLRTRVLAANDEIDQKHKDDIFWEHIGAVDKIPPRERAFVLAPTQQDANPVPESGCGQNRITFELVIVYLTEEGWQSRMLTDGDALIRSIWAIFDEGLVRRLEEPLTQVTLGENFVLYTRTIEIDYTATRP